MKIAALICRILLGLIFLTFGSNVFIHFIPMHPMPGTAGQFATALYVSHYVIVVGLLEVIPAVLLLINRYVPLALTLLAPVIVNIFFFHVFMAPSGLPMAIIVIILWIIVFISVKSAFAGLFQQKASS
jgi:putative oxidoreductase